MMVLMLWKVSSEVVEKLEGAKEVENLEINKDKEEEITPLIIDIKEVDRGSSLSSLYQTKDYRGTRTC